MNLSFFFLNKSCFAGGAQLAGAAHPEGGASTPEQRTGAATASLVGAGAAETEGEGEAASASGVLVEKRDAQVGSFEGGTAAAGVIAAFTRLVTAAVPELLRAAKVRSFPGLDQCLSVGG